MDSISVNELEFKLISQGSSFLGSDKGGWIYASQRPRYEVQLPDYYILEEPITRRQVAGLLGEDDEIEDTKDSLSKTDEEIRKVMISSNRMPSVR